MAADHAGVAADAGVHVDGHAPLVTFVLVIGIQRDGPARRRFDSGAFVDRLRIAHVLVARDRAHQAPALHQMVILRAGERIGDPRAGHLYTAAVKQRIRCADQVCVEAGAAAHVARECPAVPEVDGDAIVGVTDDREHRTADAAPLKPQFNQLAHDLPVFAAGERRIVRDLEPFGRGGADDDGVVPRQLRDRFGQFLQPPVVGKAAVKDGGIGAKGDFDRRRLVRRWRARRRRHRRGSRRHAYLFRRERGARHDAVVEPPAPLQLEWAGRHVRRARRRFRAFARSGGGVVAPELTNDVVSAALGTIGHRRQEFVRRAAAVERSDQRLNDRHGAVVSARIAP